MINININGDSFLREDHSSDSIRGDVSLCYKDYLSLIVTNDLSS